MNAERLGAALAFLAPVVLFFAWALDEPRYAPLVPPGAAPKLPPLDVPCAGDVLLADPALDDDNFRGTAILLCHHDEGGALGVVLNRPASLSPTSLLGEADWHLGPVRWGGPVGAGQGVGIYRRDGTLRLTTLRPAVAFPLGGWLWPPRITGDEWLLLAVGYAGWEAGQLEEETAAGAWILSDLTPEAVLRGDAGADSGAR